MFYIIKSTIRASVSAYNTYKDPRVEQLPLVGSPFPALGIVALYLLFSLKWGPKWMERREAYDLKNLIAIYNAIQVIANAGIVIFGLKYTILQENYSALCQPLDSTNVQPWMNALVKICYCYYITKYLDLLDTVFFVLRKKNAQISFLHVYHHFGMVLAVYLYMKFLAGSHSTMLGLVNGFVHTIMYGYYLVTSIKPSYGKSLWWKRYITQLQLLQFGYLLIHFSLVIFWNTCGHPLWVGILGGMQSLFMLCMFSEFYFKAYLRKKKVN